ncbi:MAG: hypothetical protein LBQ31_00205 [Bacteroidales bacterium]|nr:hypothetical protein [Bacteroidales bacterium]
MTRLRGLCRARATSLRSNNLLPARKNKPPALNPPTHSAPSTAPKPPQAKGYSLNPSRNPPSSPKLN